MNVIKSGAFLQQCFSVHPLSLSLKLVTPPELIGVVCTNCRMKHRMTLRQVADPATQQFDSPTDGLETLATCAQTHPKDVRISLVDVVHDSVELRCRSCGRTHLLTIGQFETQQSTG